MKITDVSTSFCWPKELMALYSKILFIIIFHLSLTWQLLGLELQHGVGMTLRSISTLGYVNGLVLKIKEASTRYC
uniref:Uncharacterized protein n=1 Tax=Rhizophora mucronata TaxID=61149 RepID=A0A2P2MWN5_RHIMU